MARKKKGPPVYRMAAAVTHRTPALQIQEQHQIRATAPNSPVFGLVQETLKSWNSTTDAYADLLTQTQSAEKNLGDLRARLHQTEAQFRIEERGYRGMVQMASQGKPELIQSLGYSAITGRTATLATVSTPTDLVAVPGVDLGAVHLSWAATRLGKQAFAVQQSAEPATETSWVSLPGTGKRRYRLGDLRPGEVLSFRVAMVGPAGQSAWTAPVRVTVR